MEIKEINITTLIPYDRNPRVNDHAIDAVAAAIREYGFKVPIIAKSDGTIIDGHLRYKAAKKLNLDTVPVVYADDLTDTQIKAFRLSVNKMAELAEWDDELLKLELTELDELDYDIESLGFDDIDLSLDEPSSGLTDEDAVPFIPDTPISKRGDVWLLGGSVKCPKCKSKTSI